MARKPIRNLDDDVVETLGRRASLHGNSLEQEPRIALIATAHRPVEDRLADAWTIRSRLPRQTSDSADLIRQDRDTRWVVDASIAKLAGNPWDGQARGFAWSPASYVLPADGNRPAKRATRGASSGFA